MKITEKWKGFGIGLAMTGMAVFTAAAPQGAQKLCAGACSQCYACGLTALPLVLWLAAKRWRPIEKIREYLCRISTRQSCPAAQSGPLLAESEIVPSGRSGVGRPRFRL